MHKLPRTFYNRPTDQVAKDLLGKTLVYDRGGIRFRIRLFETEAYMGPGDKACHGFGYRRTSRTEPLYLPPGHVYIYKIYGVYYCLNFVTEQEGFPAAVLIRGGIPLEGESEMAKNRYGRTDLTNSQRKNLLNGPGKLCAALGLDFAQNKLDLTGNILYMAEEDDDPALPPVTISKRVGLGISSGEAADYPLRFYVDYSRIL